MKRWMVMALILSLAACGSPGTTADEEEAASGDQAERSPAAPKSGQDETKEAVRPPLDPFPSTYTPYPGETTVITNATILTGSGEQIDGGSLVMAEGKISAIGPDIAPPQGAAIIDAAGKWVTPGIIDIHSHLGVYPSPGMASTSDGNEATSPNTAQVWAEHSVWPQDPGFTRALAGGITSLQILPGSANLFGGRTVTLKNTPSRTVQGMKFPGAPYGIKMACGENPKRVYENSGPATRMANFAGYRAAWIEAQGYKKKWEDYWSKIEEGGEDAEGAEPPSRDLKLETLMGVLNGDIIVNMHCYRADEMVQVLDMAKEFEYQVTAFHHAIEAYKIADYLAQNKVCAAVWSDWWGFKLEAYDTIRENAAFVHAQPGGCAIIHSDSDSGIQRLNQEAAKAMADGRNAGVDVSEKEAIAWITLNPAKAMGVSDQTGSLEPGKMADVVIWSGNPFSVYAQAEHVFIDGAHLFDRSDPTRSPRMDFEIGQQGNAFTGGAGQ
ncbi:MAG: amidohydrolase [Pseudomonadota bacterium]